LDSRYKLIDIAAFLDRVDRHEGETDFRHTGFHKALEAMLSPGDKPRAQAVLEALSDHSEEAIPKATIPKEPLELVGKIANPLYSLHSTNF